MSVIIEKWLKEVHGIYINICNLNNKEYAITSINKIGNNYNFPNYNTKTYSSHEEALEKGIQKALTLITNNMAKLNEEIQRAIDNVSDTLYREEIYINNKHEYDYHKLEAAKNVTVHTLYFSDDEEWADNMKKQVAMQLVDNGDGIEIIGACTKKNLDYLEAEQLHILLRLASTSCVYQIAEPTPKKEF